MEVHESISQDCLHDYEELEFLQVQNLHLTSAGNVGCFEVGGLYVKYADVLM